MHANEVQHYASPILVKSRQFFATLTSERLIIDGGPSPREFKVSSILSANPCKLESGEPGLKLILSTPDGQKEMIWGFPVDPKFKAGEQEAWTDQISRVSGDKPFAEGKSEIAGPQSAAPPRRPVPVQESKAIVPKPEISSNNIRPDFVSGEAVVIETAGVRVKRTFYTIYLTNIRLILQNTTGKIGREFAIAELMDAAAFETEGGEPAIALSVGSQTGAKQMVMSFPTESARSAWMQELKGKLPARQTLISAPPKPTVVTCIGIFTPETGERVILSTGGVRIKRNYVTLHLTNTRLVIEGKSAILGEFSLNTLARAIRLAGEVGEPGIVLQIAGSGGEKEMHLLFSGMPERELWIQKLSEIFPEEEQSIYAPESAQYKVTTVSPPTQRNSRDMYCPACGARNHVDDEVCALCGSLLHPAAVSNEWAQTPARKGSKRTKAERHTKREKPERRGKSERVPYNGGTIGFITRPTDAFSYHMRETPRDALGMFLLSGALWAVLTVLMITYVVPVVLHISTTDYPIFSALQTDLMLLVLFILVLYVIWLIAVMIQALATSIVARVCEPEVRFSEITAIVMRSTLSYTVIGWIPILGQVVASIWSAVVTWKGLTAGQNMRAGQAAVSAFFGMIIVYILLFAIGSI
ncbi:Yip1 family protein [uncultured Methanocorpusculum sp.]|nr:Yip1 family protein [uncultured Methanocorpusculum sp.]